MREHFLDFALWFPLVAGAGMGLIMTRYARDWAGRLGLVDKPDGRRKTHASAVPVSGGLAVLAATVAAVTCTVLVAPQLGASVALESRRVLALFIAALTITAIGLLDDLYNLRARYKLLGQLVAACTLVVFGGFAIERVSLFGWMMEFGPFAGAFSIFWLLACMNSLNLIDGMDGLLGTVGTIGLLSLAVMALMTGQIFVAMVAFAMAGALAGFLWFNLPPATIYLGDAGSMLIGLVMGALAIPSSLKGPATVALFCPVAILILPVLDTTAAIVRRKLTGRGLAIADRGHFHHVLQRNGLTVRRILILVASLCLVASTGALVSTAMNNDIFAILSALGVAVTLLISRLFGHAEFDLIRQRVSHSVRNVLQPRSNESVLAVRLQGLADWEMVWRELATVAEEVKLSGLSLDINSPYYHENYLARWTRPGKSDSVGPAWKMEIPLFEHGHYLGRLLIESDRYRLSIRDQMHIVAEVGGRAEALVAEQIGLLRTPIEPIREAVGLDRGAQRESPVFATVP